jgi:hypothetical protein
LAHHLVGFANACADDGPITPFASVEQVVKIDCLMRAVKIADANVQNRPSIDRGDSLERGQSHQGSPAFSRKYVWSCQSSFRQISF